MFIWFNSLEIRSHGVVGQEAPRTLRITAIDLKKVEWRDGEAVALLSFGRLVQ